MYLLKIKVFYDIIWATDGERLIMDKLDKYWDEVHLKYNSTYDGWLNKYVDLFDRDNSFVELGCGRAYCSNYLLENGFQNIIACDFSEEVLKIVNEENPILKTMLFDMREGLPFGDDSFNVVIADLCLHYFDTSMTNFIFNEIYRILRKDGYLIGRVNATNDRFHIPNNALELEKNFFYDGDVYKKFFERYDLESLFREFEVCDLEQKNMSRYEKPKVLWEFCVKKSDFSKKLML